ncbi:MAG: DUF2007 domain-containing protein [Anaerolineales bacterium]|nr:DUF2007 domain-containing protein [Anaerolineales bacterium]
MPPEIAWASVTVAGNRIMAEIVRGQLEAAGIKVMLAGESYAVTYGLPEPVEVLVPSDQLAEAERVLAENAAGADEPADPIIDDDGDPIIDSDDPVDPAV